jgi:transposase
MTLEAANERIDNLSTQNNLLLSRNSELETEVSELNRTVTILSNQLIMLKRGMFGRKSEKLSSSGVSFIPLFPESEPEVAETSELEVIKEHTRSKRNGRGPLPENLPRERVEYPPKEACCSDCGKELSKIGEDVTEELEVVPAKVFVREHVRGRYACSSCRNKVITSELPSDVQIVDRVRAGTGLLADIIVKKYCDHLPLNRQEKIFERSGINLPRSTMCDWLGYCAFNLEPIVAQMRRSILESHLIHADETPLDIQTPEGMKRGYLWGYLGDKREVVFEATLTRGGQHPKKFLDAYSGYLQADAYAGYNDFFESTLAIRIGCWAHVRRKFFDARSTDPPRCKEILEKIGQLFAVERHAKDNPLPPEQHLELRYKKSRLILDTLEQLFQKATLEAVPKSPVYAAAQYALKQWDELVRYLEDTRLRLDNNPIEQQIRPIAVGRHNWLFAGSENGAKRAAIFFSLINSCKLQKINPWEYLNDVLKKLATHPSSRISELTPRGWAQHKI